MGRGQRDGGGACGLYGSVCDEEEEDLCGERGQPPMCGCDLDCAASATARAAWGTE